MSKYQVKRPGHFGEIKRLDEQARVSDLPAAAAAHEAPELLLRGPSSPRSLLLEGAEGSELSLSVNDLFEVAIDPLNGKAGVIYTDDAHTTDSDGNPLPQIVLAQQN